MGLFMAVGLEFVTACNVLSWRSVALFMLYSHMLDVVCVSPVVLCPYLDVLWS